MLTPPKSTSPAVETLLADDRFPSVLALECAMDELADALRLDPADSVCATIPRSIRSGHCPLPRAISPERCARAPPGSAGTSAAQPRPASARGRFVGLGVASAIRGDVLQSAMALARLENDGRLTVELAMTDIGTGTYTILSQIAAETMELPVSRITVRLGDTRYNRPGHRTRQVRHATRSKELVCGASSWIAYQGERKHRHDRPRS